MHHQRRRSGHASGNTSMTDVRRAVTATDPSYRKYSSRPAPMTRKITPQSVPKLARNTRDRERDREEERWWDQERQSFPEYCMICEKQFVPANDQSLYCSEECRMHDHQSSPSFSTAASQYTSSHLATQYPFYSGPPEPRDIIPRASPSRPSSTHISPPVTPASAMSALKSLSIRPASPTSPVGTYHSGIWPFARSVTATSPNNSYSRQATGLYSSTYDGAYYGAGADYYGTSADRPLPSRRPAAYSRPKSIELVTPMLGR